MKFLATCLLGILVLPSVGVQKTQRSSHGSVCHEFAFDGRVSGGEEYSHEFENQHCSPAVVVLDHFGDLYNEFYKRLGGPLDGWLIG